MSTCWLAVSSLMSVVSDDQWGCGSCPHVDDMNSDIHLFVSIAFGVAALQPLGSQQLGIASSTRDRSKATAGWLDIIAEPQAAGVHSTGCSLLVMQACSSVAAAFKRHIRNA